MKSVLSFLLACLLLLPCFALGETDPAGADELEIVETEDEAELPAELRSIPLPVDFTGGAVPDEDLYYEDISYADPTIQVKIEFKDAGAYIHGYRGKTAGYWVADIRIGHASQFRTAAAESFDTDTALPVSVIADRVNAVVASNGDFVARLNKEGYVIRQGKQFRDRLRGLRDVLLVDEDGDFHVVHLPKKGEVADSVDGKKVMNAFYFGPVLVENGEVPKKLPSFTHLNPESNYTRLALCQVGPLHYKIIMTTMKIGNSLGLQLKDFAQLCRDEGVQTAYNLDGGYSTELYFHHKRLNNQENRDASDYRAVPDILYFASAWNGEE